jgi:chromosome segregation ATPase
MPAPQTDTYLLMGSTTGLLSFFLTLLLGQSVTTALGTSAIAIPTSLCGGAIANRRRIINARRYRGSLYNNILELEEEEAELYDTIQENLQTYQDLQAQVNSLSIQHNQLQNSLNHLQNQQHKFQYSFETTYEQNQKQEIYYQQLKEKIAKLRKKEDQIQSAIDTKNSFIQFKELRVNHLQGEIKELIQQKQDLRGEVYDLEMQIRVLQQRQEQVQREFLSLQIRKAELEETQPNDQQIASQQAEKEQLENQLKQLQQKKQKLELEINDFAQKQTQQPRELLPIDSPANSEDNHESGKTLQKNFLENWQEWLDFTQQLTQSETSALKAILAEDEAQLKDIADLKFVMPQVLVEAINQKALMYLGDTILTAHSSATLPEIYPEYYQALTQAMAKVK